MDANFKKFKNIKVSPSFDLEKDLGFHELILNLKETEILHVHLLMRFYWGICRIGAFETEQELHRFRTDYPGYVKSVYIGKQIEKMSDFVDHKFVDSNSVYLNLDRSLYQVLDFKSPGILACWGYCNKKFPGRIERLVEKFSFIKDVGNEVAKKDQETSTQLGGTILINSKGKIIFCHSMNFVGDHAKPEDIISAVRGYFGNNLKPRIRNIEQLPSETVKQKPNLIQSVQSTKNTKDKKYLSFDNPMLKIKAPIESVTERESFVNMLRSKTLAVVKKVTSDSKDKETEQENSKSSSFSK